MLLAPPVGGSQTDERLDTLFGRLKTTDNNAEGAGLTQVIWEIWRQSDNDVLGFLGCLGVRSMDSCFQFN